MAKGLGEYSLEALTASEVASGSGDILREFSEEGEEGMKVGGLLLEREERGS